MRASLSAGDCTQPVAKQPSEIRKVIYRKRNSLEARASCHVEFMSLHSSAIRLSPDHHPPPARSSLGPRNVCGDENLMVSSVDTPDKIGRLVGCLKMSGYVRIYEVQLALQIGGLFESDANHPAAMAPSKSLTSEANGVPHRLNLCFVLLARAHELEQVRLVQSWRYAHITTANK